MYSQTCFCLPSQATFTFLCFIFLCINLFISNQFNVTIDEHTLPNTSSLATNTWPEPITWSDTELEQNDSLSSNDMLTLSYVDTNRPVQSI